MGELSFEKATYKGRVISDQWEMRGAYCGSVSFSAHCRQLKDPDSWVHASKQSWLKVYIRDVNKEKIEAINKRAENEISDIIDEAERRFNKHK